MVKVNNHLEMIKLPWKAPYHLEPLGQPNGHFFWLLQKGEVTSWNDNFTMSHIDSLPSFLQRSRLHFDFQTGDRVKIESGPQT